MVLTPAQLTVDRVMDWRRQLPRTCHEDPWRLAEKNAGLSNIFVRVRPVRQLMISAVSCVHVVSDPAAAGHPDRAAA